MEIRLVKRNRESPVFDLYTIPDLFRVQEYQPALQGIEEIKCGIQSFDTQAARHYAQAVQHQGIFCREEIPAAEIIAHVDLLTRGQKM